MPAENLRLFSVILVLAVTIHSTAFAEVRPPAGQRCPAGAYVTGFDLDGNILCSEPARDADAQTGKIIGASPVEPGAPGTKTAQPTRSVTETAPSATAASTAAPATRADAPPEITGVEPWSVVYGKRALDVVITGSGFTPGSRVVFNGQHLDATVNSTGTELRATLNTAGLAIGQYSIGVINASGAETSLKRAVVVY